MIEKRAAIANDLDEVRKAVFGDVGDEPDVYSDYDRCSELSGKIRRAIEALRAQPEASDAVAGVTMAADMLTAEQVADHIGVTRYSDMRPFVVQAVKYAREKDALVPTEASRIKELEGERDYAVGAMKDARAYRNIETNHAEQAEARAERAEAERDAAKSGNRYAQLEAQALARIKELEGELAQRDEILIAAGKNDLEIRALLEQTQQTLEPFAAYTTADGIDGTDFLRIPDNHPILFNGLGDDAEAVVLIKHFRRARATLTAISSKGGSDAEG